MKDELKMLVASVDEARGAVVTASAAVTDPQAVFRPKGGWSIRDVAEHLYLAELVGVARIWEAATAFRNGRRWDGELPNRGKRIEQIVAETWKPKEQAPPVAEPRGEGPLQFWAAALQSLRPVLAQLAARLDPLPLDEVIFPHFLSGPLDARQRLEFLRYHMERHLGQIQRIRESTDFPG